MTVNGVTQTRCDFRWELLDPNEEDRALYRQHWCGLSFRHDGGHMCVCGARPGED